MKGFRWNLDQDNFKEESDGFKYLILVNEEWYITTSKDKEEQLHSGLQNEENLNSSKQDMCWAPWLSLSIGWRIKTSRENLEEQLKNEKNPWRTTL